MAAARWLEGKVALVTGGASGIGRAIVEGFVAEGARVGVLDRSETNLARLAADLGPQVAVTCGDVTSPDDDRRATAATVDAFGRLDAFVGNAGIFDGYVRLRDLPLEAAERGFDELFRVNVLGCLLGAGAVLPELERTSGSMIFTVSGAGFYPDGGGAIYTASKHALVGLIRQLAFELAPGIRVNGVGPGGTLTDLAVAASLRGLAPPRPAAADKEARVKQRNPLRLVMRAEDHVGAYVLLASDRARAVTGTVIESDGGLGVRGMAPGGG